MPPLPNTGSNRPAAYGSVTRAPTDESFVAVNAVARYGVVERLRCVELATGQIVYEFWTDGKQIMQIDAASYDAALAHARRTMSFEPSPEDDYQRLLDVIREGLARIKPLLESGAHDDAIEVAEELRKLKIKDVVRDAG